MKNNKEDRRETERQMLPFLIEFIKFATGFAIILVVAFFVAYSAAAAMGAA